MEEEKQLAEKLREMKQKEQERKKEIKKQQQMELQEAKRRAREMKQQGLLAQKKQKLQMDLLKITHTIIKKKGSMKKWFYNVIVQKWNLNVLKKLE